MGHSQSYDLQTKLEKEKAREPVREIRRTSRENETDNPIQGRESSPTTDNREEQLRDRIRQEQLRQRENELDTMRIRQHESRDPIIDAYRQNSSPVINEFNHYDNLKHHHPTDPKTYDKMAPSSEVNSGRVLPVKSMATPPIPSDPHQKRTVKDDEWPKPTPIFSGRVSPFPLQEEVNEHPMPRYVPPMSAPRYDLPVGTYSKTTTVTTYTHWGPLGSSEAQRPKEPEKRAEKKVTVVPQYDEVPTVPQPKYDEVPYTVTLPVSTTTTYSKKTHPLNPPPKSPSHSSTVPYRTYRTPKYDEVPVVVVPRRNTIVIPIVAGRLDYLNRAEEVPYVPLKDTVTYSIPPRHRYRSPTPSSVSSVTSVSVQQRRRSSTVSYRTPTPSPSILDVNYRSKTPSPKIITPPSPRIYRTRLEKEERGTPLSHHVDTRDTVPYSTPPKVQKSPRDSSAYSTPPKSPTVLYRTPLQKEERETPLSHYVAPKDTVPYRTPLYDVPPSPTDSDAPTVLYRTPLQKEERGTPLSHYVVPKDTVSHSTTPPKSPVLYRTPLQAEVPRDTVPYRTPLYDVPPSPTVSDAPTVLYRTPLQKEERGTPLSHHVAPRDTVPYSTPQELYRSSPKDSPILQSSPKSPTTVLYRTPLQPEERGTPMSHYVARRRSVASSESPQDYSNLPVVRAPPYGTSPLPRKSTVTSRRSSAYSTPPFVIYYRTAPFPEIRATPLPNYVIRHTVPSQSSRSPSHTSELHAEKRMIVGIDDTEHPDHVSHVTIEEFPTYSTTSSLKSSPLSRHLKAKEPKEPEELLQRVPEVQRHPIYMAPAQTSYEVHHYHHMHTSSKDKETQCSRRPSEDVAPKCQVENCTHVEIRDTPEVIRRRESSIPEKSEKENNRLTIYVDENEDVGSSTSQSKRCFEETLHYDSYMPTLSLKRRPVVSFYDKLH